MENCKHVIFLIVGPVLTVCCVSRSALVCVWKGFYIKRIVLEAYILPVPGSIIPVPECPGRYCGRTLTVPDENFSAETCYSDCTVSHTRPSPYAGSSLATPLPNSPPLIHQACSTGSRVDSNSSLCVQCDDPALLRDYFFLGFLCLVCVAVRLAVIVSANIGQPRWVAKL